MNKEVEVAKSAEIAEAEAQAPVEMGPIRLGVKFFLFDNGLTFAFTIIVGIILLLVGYTSDDIVNNKALMIVGLLISLYAAFLLYRNYSKETKAFIALAITSVVASLLDLGAQVIAHHPLHIAKELIAVAADLAAYGVGWYLAATTNFKIFLFNKKWTTVFFVIGAIALVFGLIGSL